MDDLDKVKIDILRDALKDAMDTVRALDRKIVFLASFNGIFLGLISTLFFKQKVLKNMISNIELFYCGLGIIAIFWIILFIQIMKGIAPKSNPIDVFKSDTDKKFSNNLFFIFTDGKKKSLELSTLVESYEKIDSYKKIQKLLYKEIGKLSYIRDTKINSIKTSVKYTWLMITIFTVFFIGFILKFSHYL
jgi:hypothetical protein